MITQKLNNTAVALTGVRRLRLAVATFAILELQSSPFLFCNFLQKGLAKNSTGGDTSYYLSQADALVEKGGQFYAETLSTPWYWGYPTFLAIILGIFHSNAAVVLVQILLKSFGILALFCVAKDLCRNTAAAFISAGFLAVNFDAFQWDYYILTDSLGFSLECFTIFFYYFAYARDRFSNSGNEDGISSRNKGFFKVFFWVILCLFFMTRTNAISLILVFVFSLIFMLDRRKRNVVLLCIFALAAIILAALMIAGRGNGFGLLSRLEYTYNEYATGIVIHDRPEYSHPIDPAHEGTALVVLDILQILGLRAVMYWSIDVGYSGAHVLINAVTLLPVFLLAVYSVIIIIRNHDRRYYVYIWGALVYYLLQICTEIDYDFRYRIPIFALLTVINSAGLKVLFEKVHS